MGSGLEAGETGLGAGAGFGVDSGTGVGEAGSGVGIGSETGVGLEFGIVDFEADSVFFDIQSSKKPFLGA